MCKKKIEKKKQIKIKIKKIKRFGSFLKKNYKKNNFFYINKKNKNKN